ncbi:MAG: hypothetical protein ACJ75P_06250 [Gaiellaceae bacterium]
MTSIAQEKPRTAATAPVERAVFVTDDDRRSRIVRRAALVVLAAAGLWLVALALGMLGLGQLPGVSLPLPTGGAKTKQRVDRSTAEPIVRTASPRPTRRTSGPAAVRSSAPVVAAAPVKRGKAQAGAARTGSAPARRRATTPPAATASPPPQASTPPRVARGLERRGLTAAPGQTRKAAAEPKTVPAQAKTPQGQAKKTDATQPAPPPPPAPPGQLKPDKPPPKA